MLYQVATGLVAEADISISLRKLFANDANVQVLLGEVVDLDPAGKAVIFNDNHLAYDHLILATGSGSSYFGHEDWRPLAPPMKILEHADEIRRRLLNALEEAEQCPDPERRRFLQSAVVVGGGPTGCESGPWVTSTAAHARPSPSPSPAASSGSSRAARRAATTPSGARCRGGIPRNAATPTRTA
jgi:NADH dehydrogenase